MAIGAATTTTAVMKPIDNCTVMIPFGSQAAVGPNQSVLCTPRILPDISDSKGTSYSDEPVIGRSFPIKTFGHGENRIINMKWHFAIVDSTTLTETVTYLKAFQSCVYPQPGNGGTPYQPPVICTISCQNLLYGGSGTNGLCAVLKSYNVSYPTDVVYDESTFLPLRFDIDLVWEVVYPTSQLPGSDKIIT